MIYLITMKAKKMYKNKNKNTRDKATQPANATRTVYYEELDELKLESVAAGWMWLSRREREGIWKRQKAMRASVRAFGEAIKEAIRMGVAPSPIRLGFGKDRRR